MKMGGCFLTAPALHMKRRIVVLLLAFTITVFALIGRLAYLQIIQAEFLQKKAFMQQNTERPISAKRGKILDRNLKELAVSASVETVTASPSNISKSGIPVRQVAQGIAQILGMNEETVYSMITKNTSYQIIKKKIEKEDADKLRQWIKDNKVKGIYIDEDTKRYYPMRNLAAHIIGFTGADNQGLAGVEKTMDKYLTGIDGKILGEVDSRGRELPFRVEKRIEPQDGLNVVLTIDETIQFFAQKALERAIIDNKVYGGAIAIVMDPRNGDVLAMVSKPDFDPNDPYAPPQGIPDIDLSNWKGRSSNQDVQLLLSTVWRNKAISDTYEPGSTFKAITSAAGLEEGVVTPETRVNDYPVTIGKWTLHCWRRGRLHGEETFAEGVYNSCNPVFVRVAQSLGIQKFYSYVKAFGFYEKTGIDLIGEPEKMIFHKNPAEIDMAVASFGQRFQITPIQLITAYSAIANGGKLMKPRLVKELTDFEGNVVQKNEPQVVRTVISKETSNTLCQILEGVVSKGTGKNAYVRGYRVAGKTGTSETTKKGVYVASFCAFAPADNPVISVLVALFDPRGDSHMGGAIAAPVAGKIIEDALSYLGVERRYSEEEMKEIVQEVIVPDVTGKTIEEAVKILKQVGLQYKVEGETLNKNDVVRDQMPKRDASIPNKSTVLLYTKKLEKPATVKVPNVLNKTVSEATETLNKAGLNIRVNGRGIAVRQNYEPDSYVPKGEIIEVEFRQIDNIE